MIIFGKNSVLEFLRNSPSEIIELIISNSSGLGKDSDVRSISQNSKIKVSIVEKNYLDQLCKNKNHQGIAAKVEDFQYSTVKAILELPNSTNRNSFILILDHIEDPHNLGAIIRSADFLGVDGIVIPKDRACDVTPTVIKVSSGAARNIKIAKEINLSQLIDSLKKKDIWIVGADGDSNQSLTEQDFKNINIAVVIGNEGRGLSKKIKEKCDFLLSIPQIGNVESLNASVAAGIFLYEISKQRVS